MEAIGKRFNQAATGKAAGSRFTISWLGVLLVLILDDENQRAERSAKTGRDRSRAPKERACRPLRRRRLPPVPSRTYTAGKATIPGDLWEARCARYSLRSRH